MRRTLTSAAVICIVIGSTQPAVLGKKNKENISERLRSLQTIYVDGSSFAVSYISKNLSHETCLNYTPDETEADAVLEVWEESPVPCGGMSGPMNGPMTGGCSHIQAKLLDPKTRKILWYREDEHLPQVDLIHHLNGPYQWVLWNLKNSCCKGRPSASPSQESKE
jgi:hypothetical protein